MSDPQDESQVAKQKKLAEDKKRVFSYLKNEFEMIDRGMARNFVSENFALAAQDCRKMASILEVLGDLHLS